MLVPKNPCCCESALDIALVPDVVPKYVANGAAHSNP
jgi:hypothetical protein